MANIKIISDPYKNIIIYQKQNPSNSNWVSIDNPNSKLLSEKLTKCVFPFNVKEIVDVIFGEFKSGNETIEITFEGTDDEFEDLTAICTDEIYNGMITAVRGNQKLNNARDIFEKVKSKFDEVKLLVYSNNEIDESIERERRKFEDVSKDVIPICVLGNYSCGKSTFINALIGYELLPSGDKPLTAKIHKISRSKETDRGSIRFQYNGIETEIKFLGSEQPDISCVSDNQNLYEKLCDEINNMNEYSPILCANKVLGVMNRIEDDSIGNLIEIAIPFSNEGEFGKSRHEFVIFDTPGSNAASNEKHLEVLKNAMNNLSNGLPIYVSEFNDLDTKDNEKLCKEIKEMKELDSRFSMIVVNRADEANFEGFFEDEVLEQIVPRKLYAGGLYYTSSIMGLGAKNGGKFIDRHYGKIFRQKRTSFEDCEDEDYEQIFKYNICPNQIKDKLYKDSECCDNKILANSGLYWIEKEIENFAGKYSPYNKCQQSLRYLHNVMEKTETRIEEKRDLCEYERKNFENQLEEGKKRLINNMEQKSEEQRTLFFDNFRNDMGSVRDNSDIFIRKEELDSLNDMFFEDIKSRSDYDAQNKEIEESQKRFLDSAKDIFSDPKGLKHIAENAKEIFGQRKELSQIRKNINSDAANEVFDYVKDKFNTAMTSFQEELNLDSCKYWTEKSKEMRNALIDVVRGNSSLDDNDKNAVIDIISQYEQITFYKQAYEIFHLNDYKPMLSIFGFKLIEGNRLNLAKLEKSYNQQILQGMGDLFEKVKKEHGYVFDRWTDDLLNKTKEIVTDFNPELNNLVKSIDDKNRSIRDLEYRKDKLRRINEEITELMSFREV